MIDRAAFHSLSYGLYLVTSKLPDGRKVGCVANTFAQVSSNPPLVSVALNKENATTAAIRESGRFAASVLAESAGMELIGAFGFKSSLEVDKFAGVQQEVDEAQIPCITEKAVACFSVKVIEVVEAGTHLLFVGEVEQARTLSDEKPMTYAYYHQVLRGKTPPKAATYDGSAGEQVSTAEGGEAGATGPTGNAAATAGGEAPLTRTAWQCTLCGYIEYVDELPDDFVCPICGATKDFFERIEVPIEG